MEPGLDATAFATDCSPLLNKIKARGTLLPDLEDRIVRLRREIDSGSHQPSDVERFDLLWELAFGLCSRYELTFDIADLNKSILTLQQIVDFTVAKLGRLADSPSKAVLFGKLTKATGHDTPKYMIAATAHEIYIQMITKKPTIPP